LDIPLHRGSDTPRGLSPPPPSPSRRESFFLVLASFRWGCPVAPLRWTFTPIRPHSPQTGPPFFVEPRQRGARFELFFLFRRKTSFLVPSFFSQEEFSEISAWLWGGWGGLGGGGGVLGGGGVWCGGGWGGGGVWVGVKTGLPLPPSPSSPREAVLSRRPEPFHLRRGGSLHSPGFLESRPHPAECAMFQRNPPSSSSPHNALFGFEQ